MTDEITLYDLASNRPNPRGWSSNTLKARFALQLKGIPFKTVWVEFPDIESVCKSLGAPPTSVWPDGQPMYTLPVIKDPGTNTVLADSWAIAKYLDATYTARPPLIPEGTDGLQAAFSDAATRIAMMPMSQAFLPLIPNLLNPSSIPYYRFRREQMLGLKLEDFCPLEKRPEVLDTAKKGFSVVAGWYAKSGKEYLMGEKPCFADLSLGAFLAGTKQIFGEQSDEWKLIKTWDDGRWARLLKSIESLYGCDQHLKGGQASAKVVSESNEDMFEIVLYDLPRKDPESGPWSPNTLKTRLALKYKGLPFKTVWLEYPDIVAECKKIGAPPTGAQPDGSPFYTLPVIYDPSTKKAVADSYAIAEYLDATYPTDRQLMPAGTEGLHAAFYSAFDNHGFFPLVFVYGPLIPTILNPPSEEYFRRTKKETLEQMAQTEQDEALRKGKAGFDVIQGWYEKAGKGKLFLMGDTPSWADIVVASTLASARNILGRHSEAWKAISEWHGGRWVRLTAALAE